VLAAPVLAAVALTLHQLLPSRHDALPTAGLYTLLLQVLLAAALLMAALHWAWRPLRGWAGYYGPLIALAIGWLCVWDLCTLKLLWLPRTYLVYCPAPDHVLQGIREDWREILVHICYSLRLLLTGYVVGVALGLAWGVLMGWFGAVRYWGMPVTKLLGPLPATALVTVAMMFSARLGITSFYPGVLPVAFAVWFPMTMLTTSGIRNVPASYFDVARTLGAGRLYLIFRVAIPAALPNIFLGMFTGLVVAFLTFYVAETFGVSHGLGYYIEEQRNYLIFAKVWGTLIILAALCSGLLTLLFKMRDLVLGWQKGMIRW
jgi:NitT/TauT family transport system permease protein